MIKTNLPELLWMQKRNLAWLARETNLQYSTLHRFANGKTASVSYDLLNKVCTALDCRMGALMIFEQDPVKRKRAPKPRNGGEQR